LQFKLLCSKIAFDMLDESVHDDYVRTCLVTLIRLGNNQNVIVVACLLLFPQLYREVKIMKMLDHPNIGIAILFVKCCIALIACRCVGGFWK
jgi:hypothetical protein